MRNYISPTIFYICNDFERALGLERFLPNFHIICIDYNKGIDAARKVGAKIFCLEEALSTKNPIYRNSNKLLNVHEVQEYIKTHTPVETVSNVMFFKIAPNIEQTCKQLGYNILNTSADLNQMFELKLSQYDKLNRDRTINFSKTIVKQLKEVDYNDLVKKLGEHFVIQYDRGHTGSSTVFVENERIFEHEQKLFPERWAKFSTKIEGNAWTLNACVTRKGILFGGLSYQITGIPQCTSKKGGTVGNDFTVSDRLHKETLEQMKVITKHSGTIMQKAGFKGLFGLDFVVNEKGHVYLIEINARQPASTGLHTKLLLRDNHIPLSIFHIAEFLYDKDHEEEYFDFINIHCCTCLDRANTMDYISDQNFHAMKHKQAAQIIIRNTNENSINANIDYQTGVYKLVGNKIELVREGYCIDNLSDHDEFLLLACEKGREISSESELARIQKRGTLLNSKLLPSDEALRIIECILN
jgi:hypothetical protein